MRRTSFSAGCVLVAVVTVLGFTLGSLAGCVSGSQWHTHQGADGDLLVSLRRVPGMVDPSIWFRDATLVYDDGLVARISERREQPTVYEFSQLNANDLERFKRELVPVLSSAPQRFVHLPPDASYFSLGTYGLRPQVDWNWDADGDGLPADDGKAIGAARRVIESAVASAKPHADTSPATREARLARVKPHAW